MKVACQNCEWTGDVSDVKTPEELMDIADFFSRLSPGEVMPYGECPECGALCHEATIPPLPPAPWDPTPARFVIAQTVTALCGACGEPLECEPDEFTFTPQSTGGRLWCDHCRTENILPETAKLWTGCAKCGSGLERTEGHCVNPECEFHDKGQDGRIYTCDQSEPEVIR